MALILNIETSSTICSVCLANGGTVIAHREDRSKNSHARVLTLLVEELLQSAGKKFTDLQAIAVSAGPGSYTGLRIGLSTAKGFCYALNIPLITIPTLQTLALSIRQKSPQATYVMPVVDARRMDAYTAVYDKNNNEVLPTAMRTLNAAFEEELTKYESIAIGGDATAKCKEVFTASNILYVDEVECDSRLMASIAENKYLTNGFADLAYSEPLYVNEFGAPPVKKTK